MTPSGDNRLKTAFWNLVAIRKFEERVHRENELGNVPGFIHLYAGTEACAVGVCMELTDRDFISSTHRGHGHAIAKGCDITAMMHELFARSSGICGGKAGSMHMADLDVGMMGANGIVGAGNPLACGAALTARTLKTGGVAISFMGDGATNQGATLESFNLASVWQLPVVFVVEDNGYAEATPSSWAIGGGDLVKRAEGFGMPGYRADGLDFFAVNAVAQKAIERARSGQGPSLLHLKTTRYYGHFEGDAATYRDKSEVADVRANSDCIERFKARVLGDGSLSQHVMDEVERDISTLVDQAVETAKAGVPPSDAAVHSDVYVKY